MRLGMSAVRGAGATPPAPGLVQNDQGVWGSWGFAPGAEVTSFIPYVVPPTPNHVPMLRSGGECPPGQSYGPIPGSNEFGCVPNGTSTTGTGDSTTSAPGTGDSTSSTQGTGDTTSIVTPRQGSPVMPSLMPRQSAPVSILPTLRQVIPCTSPWTPRAYGGTNLAPPVIGAGAASFSTTPFTLVDVLGWGTFGLGLLLGAQLINNVYANRRIAA